MNATKVRQLVTSRAFIASATGVLLAALAQAGVHVSPAVRTDAVNILSVAAPVALPVYTWLRARFARKHADGATTAVAQVTAAEDGTPGASGAGE